MRPIKIQSMPTKPFTVQSGVVPVVMLLELKLIKTKHQRGQSLIDTIDNNKITIFIILSPWTS